MKPTDEMISYMMKQKEFTSESIPCKKLEDISVEEASQILTDILDIFIKYNLSYKSACAIAIALEDALVSGIDFKNLER